MDLFSTAERLNKPFVFKDKSAHANLPIAARGIIGDGFSCALVRPDGIIDWLCFPRFDSPSVFGGLLDADRGGMTGMMPVSYPFKAVQGYDPDTNVLDTVFHVEGQGVIRMTDFMPWTDDPRLSIHEVHRRIHCIEGKVEIKAIFDPRFEYGAIKPKVEVSPHGVLATSNNGDTMVAALGGKAKWEGRDEGGMEAKFTLQAGERNWMVLSWGAPMPEPIAAYRPFEHLRSTRYRWREWASHLQYDGPWRQHVARSSLVLKLLMYAPTGAMVAAPTTSLPEWFGGTRNWDYRYTWTRDTAMSAQAAALIGHVHEARDFFHFVRDTLEHEEELKVMYTIDGHTVPKEQTLKHLSGFRQSQPVRIGNDARNQLQLDTVGALVDSAYIYEKSGGSLPLRTWRSLKKVIHSVCERWREPDHGIWEPRNSVRHNVHSRLMCWVALTRGAELATLFREMDLSRKWASTAWKVHKDLCENGLDPTGKHFVAAYGTDIPDAALLQLSLHGFLPPDHPHIVETLNWVQRELGEGSFLKRYKNYDGVGGEEGAFILCGFWLAEAMAVAGRLDEAHEIFSAHLESSNHLGLLSEEINPHNNELLGNFPQAFSHLGLINAAARIDLAWRLRDEGSKETPEFRLGE